MLNLFKKRPTKNALEKKYFRNRYKWNGRKGNPRRPSADFADIIDAITAEGRAYRNEEERKEKSSAIREWVTIGVISVTFIAVCLQVHEMIKVYEPIRIQAEAAALQAQAAASQVIAMQTQADVAAKSNNIANSAMMESNQPFIALEKLEITNFAANSPFAVKPIIRNSGNSSARDVRANFQIGWIALEQLGRNELNLITGSQMLIPKESEKSFPLTIPQSEMNAEKIALFENGKIVIELLGKIDYLDSFNRRHTLKICTYFDRTLHTFVDCGIGNTAIIEHDHPKK